MFILQFIGPLAELLDNIKEIEIPAEEWEKGNPFDFLMTKDSRLFAARILDKGSTGASLDVSANLILKAVYWEDLEILLIYVTIGKRRFPKTVSEIERLVNEISEKNENIQWREDPV